jgi:transposase
MTQLTKKEIYERMQEWRNLKKLHLTARERIKTQQELIKTQGEKIEIQKQLIANQATTIESLKLQIEELQQIIFGKRKRKKEDPDDNDDSSHPTLRQRICRVIASYKRTIPTEDEVTDKKYHSIDSCPDCGETLTRKTSGVYYEEDIIIPIKSVAQKEVTEHTIEKGWCAPCRKWRHAKAPPAVKVVLGPCVRAFVAHTSIILRLSYDQIQTILYDLYRLKISDGEIRNILRKEAILLNPEYERIKRCIDRQRGAHYDETGWRVQRELQGSYTWVRVGTETPDTLFACGQSRGKGNIERLRKNKKQTGISDDYGAYTNAFLNHQLCWSHPNRKLQDLAESEKLPTATKRHCADTFQHFSQLYSDVRKICATPFRLHEREKQKIILLKRFDKIVMLHCSDPQKLAQIKKRLQQKKECYFVCITNEGIPPDNNKAERALRHLVLKRKISFGSKTQDGADTLSVLASVLLTLKWKEPQNFFEEYFKLRTPKTA